MTLFAAASLAVAAALTADPLRPGFALRSDVVYREEVGLAVFAGAYVIVMLLWLAARGRVLGRVHLPGGAGFEAMSPSERELDELEASVEALNHRVDVLESRFDRWERA